MDIETAIKEIRKRLDEIEELAKYLPASSNSLLDSTYPTHVMTNKMRDWMDASGITKEPRIRKGLLRVANLIEDGLTLGQIKQHRLIKNKRTLHIHVDDFFQLYSKR